MRKRLLFYVVGLMMLLSLFFVQPAKTDEIKYYNWNYGAAEGDPCWYYQNGEKIENPQDLLNENVNLSVYNDPELAIAILKKKPNEKIKVNYITFFTLPKSEKYIISDHLETDSIDIHASSYVDNKYYVYNGDLSILNLANGNIIVNGNIKDTFSAGSNANEVDEAFPRNGVVKINGNVNNIRIIRKTENDSELTDYYTMDDVNKSISASLKKGYFAGNITVEGTISQGMVMDTFYSTKDKFGLIVTKARIDDNVSPGEVLVNGSIAEALKNSPQYKKYSTKEWYDTAMKERMVQYQAYYWNGTYRWYKDIYSNGSLLKFEEITSVDATTHLPNEDLKGAQVVVGGTDANGLLFTKNSIPDLLTVLSGKVKIDGDIRDIYIRDNSIYYEGVKFVSVDIAGDARDLYIDNYNSKSNLHVTGEIGRGHIQNGFRDDNTWNYSSFSKQKNNYDDVIKDGCFSDKIELSDTSGLKYYKKDSKEKIEKAAGIDESNKTKDVSGEKVEVQASEVLELTKLGQTDVDTIKSKIDEKKLEVVDKAVEIDVETYIVGKNEIKKEGKVSNTKCELEFNVQIPDYDNNSKYEIVRIHENEDGTKSYDKLKNVIDDNGYASFESDKFSKFVFCKVTGDSQKDTDTNPETGTMQIEAFCKRLYTVALDRTYDSEGLTNWTNKLADGKVTGAEVAQGFFFSDEFIKRNLDDSSFVDILYRTMFGREADADGKAYWIKALTEGMSREFVYHGFAEGDEFKNLCNSYGIKQGTVTLSQNRDKNRLLTAFVARNYTKALGRAAEEAGINDWTGRILGGNATPADVTAGFIFSAEFTGKNLSNEDFLKVVYQTYFDREPDEEGYNNWLTQLQSGASRDYVVNNGFSNSQEFANLVSSFGL